MHRFVVVALISITAFFAGIILAYAQDAEGLRTSIQNQEVLIKQLEAEIAKYQKDLQIVGSQKKNLSNAISEIETSRKRATAQIALTKEKISRSEERIRSLENEIKKRNQSIDTGKSAVETSIRFINMQDDQTFVEQMLGSASLSTSWESIDRAKQVEGSLRERVAYLQKERDSITALKNSQEVQKKELTAAERAQQSHKVSLEVARKEKEVLLSQTKNQESEFQKILQAKQAAKKEFEDQLRAYESQLKYVLDRTKLPPVGRGVLSWPLDKVTVTQRFGNTAFANSGAYNGKGHNGVDFRAPTGTPIKAALSGMIEATGNTDMYRGCYSYGKWALIRHSNNLTTLYAHLSNISVSVGQTVSTGEVIGYSGNTGYSTGPHLHFSVFASEAVRVVRMGDVRSSSPCREAAIPVSAWSGYLDPLEYL